MREAAISGARRDVVIAGGGQVGLALALALARSAPGLEVTLVDAAPAGAGVREGRASTIAAGGRRLLQTLGVWDEVADAAQPVRDMIVTDSRTRDTVRPVFLTFATASADGEASAHLVFDGVVVAALKRGARAAGVELIEGDAVSDFAAGASVVGVATRGGRAYDARLLVAADGANSRLRSLAGIDTFGWSYGQSGIVATVKHEKPHGGRAEEHFLPGGPFAILPLRPTAGGENRSSLVWTEPTETAERLIGDRVTFRTALEQRFGHKLGALSVMDGPRAFPLGLRLARTFVKDRLALTGDAAHAIHPIAGQGLNLGYRDAAALAETIVEADRLGLDIGAQATLERYQRWRRFDTMEMALATDGLNRLFSNDNPLIRIARDVGLGLVDRVPQLKGWFITQAAGEGGALPRLLKGEAI
jgi:2-octaprenyl-6-methoxyphenol hydroxylase